MLPSWVTVQEEVRVCLSTMNCPMAGRFVIVLWCITTRTCSIRNLVSSQMFPFLSQGLTWRRKRIPTSKKQENICPSLNKVLPLQHFNCQLSIIRAPVAELVDAPDLGSGIFRCAGSSPVRRTKKGCTHVHPFLYYIYV